MTDLLGQLETDAALHARYEEAVAGRTGIACFDAWAQELTATHYLHNHARMWFASIWIFTLRLPWELGADFFFRHLLDGDAASNTCSWRWVGRLHTAGKTYLARAANIREYTAGRFDPEGQLAATAPALEEPALGPRTPPAFADADLAGQRVGLLITAEDCAAEGLEADHPGLPAPVALAGWSAPVPRSLLPTAPEGRAIHGRRRSKARCRRPRPATGWQRRRLGSEESASAEEGHGRSAGRLGAGASARLHCHRAPAHRPAAAGRTPRHAWASRRRWSSWIATTIGWSGRTRGAGFFGLKKQIPGILRDLGLS